jgi:hypothetical protein
VRPELLPVPAHAHPDSSHHHLRMDGRHCRSGVSRPPAGVRSAGGPARLPERVGHPGGGGRAGPRPPLRARGRGRVGSPSVGGRGRREKPGGVRCQVKDRDESFFLPLS